MTKGDAMGDHMLDIHGKCRREREELEAQLARAERQRAEVLRIHHEYEGWCVYCIRDCTCPDEATVGSCTCGTSIEWPCPTAAIYLDAYTAGQGDPGRASGRTSGEDGTDEACDNRSFYGHACVLPPHSRKQPCKFAADPDGEEYELAHPQTLGDFLEAMSAGGWIAINAAVEWCEAELTSEANRSPNSLHADFGRIYSYAAAKVLDQSDIIWRYMERWFAVSGAGQAGEAESHAIASVRTGHTVGCLCPACEHERGKPVTPEALAALYPATAGGRAGQAGEEAGRG